MARDSTATKARILDAATAEFAAHGLAGARVDRIAERAEANKQLIYAYFGSKEGLFDATIETHLGRLLDAVPFDAADLPGYAGRFYDALVAEPRKLRLWRWHALERPGVLATLPDAVASTERKVAAVAAAQEAGRVSAALPPELLLHVLLSIMHGSVEDVHAVPGDVRAAVVHAVTRLVEPREVELLGSTR